MWNSIIAGIVIGACSVVLAAAEASGSGQVAPVSPAVDRAIPPQPISTLVGCLYRERQIPGRTPNVVERAGVLEDYILADAMYATQQGEAGATPRATGTTGSTPASGNMYKVENIADERLQSLVGKKVEVMGRIDVEGPPGSTPGGPQQDRGLGPDEINLPEFEATSIREISGTCPATPAPRK
jgi:hypothetical protein